MLQQRINRFAEWLDERVSANQIRLFCWYLCIAIWCAFIVALIGGCGHNSENDLWRVVKQQERR